MALRTSRRLVVRGAPAAIGEGSKGSKMAHCASLRSLGYGLRDVAAMRCAPEWMSYPSRN
jgi:hypothetical protein